MSHVAHAVTIHADPDVVWRVLAEPARFPDWVCGVRRVDFVTDARRGVGAQWRQVNAYGPLVVTLLNEVTEADAPTRFTVEAASKPHAEIRYRLEPVDDGRATRVKAEMDHETPGSALAVTAEPALGDAVGHAVLRRSLENLKRLVEGARGRGAPAREGRPDAG